MAAQTVDPRDRDLDELTINTLRTLAIDAVEKAASGHPGTPMALAVAQHVPVDGAQHLPLGLALLAMPLSLFFDPDSFYFGVVPVVANVAHHFGIEKVQVAQAALLGQMTTGFPVSPLTPSTFLLAGLCKINLGSHQRFAIPWLFATSIIMTFTAALLGIFPF